MNAEEKDQSVVVIDSRIAQTGSVAQIYYVLERRPQGLSLEDVAKITGLTPTTCYIRIRELFNAQMVEEVRRHDTRIYKLTRPEIVVLRDTSKRSLTE